MKIICAYCGKPFTSYDSYLRKYCPECQRKGKRYAEQFKEKRKNDPALHTYTCIYSKLHTLLRSKRITKEALDKWRHQAKIKRHEVSTGEISIEDFIKWCDTAYGLMKAGASGSMAAREYTYPLTAEPYVFVGRKPVAVLFGEERVEVKTWRQVYSVIIGRCNENPKHHEMLLSLRNRVAGKVRVFLSEKPDGMSHPYRIDEDMYGEVHYGSATLIHILVNHILKPTGFDCYGVNIVIQ